FRALTEKGTELISVVDAAGVLTYESPNQPLVLGYPAGSQLGRNMFDLVHPDDLPATRSLFQELIAQRGSSRTGELRVHTKDGNWRWLEVVGTNLLADPAVAGIVLNSRDITTRKQAEEALRRSERRYRSFVEVTSQFGWVTDSAGLVVEDIPALRKFTGQTYEQAKGVGWADALHPDDVQRTLEVWNRAVSTKMPYETEYRMRRYDGVYRLLLARGVPILDNQGGVMEWVGTCIDITDRKAAEEALRKSETSQKRAQEIGHLGSWELDLVADRLTWSDEVYRIFGLQPQEFGATYEGFLERVHPDDRAAVDAAYSGSVREGRDSYDIEHRIVRKDTGEIRYVQEKCQHVRDAQGHVVQSLGMVLDITERKAAEEALKRAHDELEIKVRERTSDLSDAVERLRVENIQRKRLEDTLRESENKVRFFASQCLTAQETERKRIASELHDSIAASLAAVRLRIERMAEETEPGSGSSESLESIASRVAEITTDVRRIMADLRPSILDDLGIMAALNWFCREFQKTYSHFSVERRIGIDEHEVPDTLKTPIFRICQEAMNNCAKHSRGSLVKVSLQKEGERILLSVQDNGQGFDLEKVNKGMGLSNIRERAELSGGASKFESAIGEGTTVRVWWPTPVGNVG
ncbi:MAG: PAS domain S-box protein, partial [Deltaproteobacteria bacterium]